MPAIDGRVELHSGIGALPRRFGDLAEQRPRLHRFQGLAGGDRLQVPVGVGQHRFHELVGDPDRVVGVLVLDRVAVLAIQVHVEAGVTQSPGLALLDRLAPDEILDVGMIGVEDDHLGRPPRFSARIVRHQVVHEVLVHALYGQVKCGPGVGGRDNHRRPKLVAPREALDNCAFELVSKAFEQRPGPLQTEASGRGRVAVGRQGSAQLTVAPGPDLVELRDRVRKYPLPLVGAGVAPCHGFLEEPGLPF